MNIVINNHIQGELVNATVSDGVIISSGGPRWYFDTTKIDCRIIPKTCTVIFEADVMYPGGEGYYDFKCSGDISFYFCFDTKFDPRANQWYNYKLKLILEDGYVVDQYFYADNQQIYHGSDGFHPIPSRFPFVDEDNVLKVYTFYYTFTRTTHLKNIQMYYI